MNAPKIKGFRFEKMTGCYRRSYPVAGRMLTILVPVSEGFLSDPSLVEYVTTKADEKMERVSRVEFEVDT